MTTAASHRPGTAILVLHPRRASDMIELDALARSSGLHPVVVERLVELGLLEPSPGPWASPRFPADAARRLARAARLRRDLSLGYAGAVFACELLARIDELELRLRRYEASTADRDGYDPFQSTRSSRTKGA